MSWWSANPGPSSRTPYSTTRCREDPACSTRPSSAGPRWYRQPPLSPKAVRPPGEDDGDPGVCIYLDGLSSHLHGNPQTAAVDKAIRAELAGRGYLVIAISAAELDDQGAMTNHFRRLARHLVGKDKADELKADTTWFERAIDA